MASFITFEGIEGCGKTTQLKLLAGLLEKQGYQVITTREPGGCAIADKVRAILLDAENRAMVPLAELLLYAAARAQHVAEIVRPALAAGKIVLCDRFTDATMAYQGFGRGLDQATIATLNQLAIGQLRPELTILLDCPVEIGLTRAIARIDNSQGAREERFELETRQFHQRVRDGYLQLAARETARIVRIDGGQDQQQVASAISAAVLARLAQKQ